MVHIGDSEDAYGRTLAYVYLDTSGDGEYEDLIELGLARTTFSHAYRREFERLREEAEELGSSGVRSRPYTVRTDDAPKVRFSATLGEEPEIEIRLA
jgi:hypothetical protein